MFKTVVIISPPSKYFKTTLFLVNYKVATIYDPLQNLQNVKNVFLKTMHWSKKNTNINKYYLEKD